MPQSYSQSQFGSLIPDNFPSFIYIPTVRSIRIIYKLGGDLEQKKRGQNGEFSILSSQVELRRFELTVRVEIMKVKHISRAIGLPAPRDHERWAWECCWCCYLLRFINKDGRFVIVGHEVGAYFTAFR